MNVIITTLILSISMYMEFYQTLWFIVGLFFGLINFYFIKKMLYELVIEKCQNLIKIALLLLIKFPLLYGTSFILLFYQREISWTLAAGFIASIAYSIKKLHFDSPSTEVRQGA